MLANKIIVVGFGSGRKMCFHSMERIKELSKAFGDASILIAPRYEKAIERITEQFSKVETFDPKVLKQLQEAVNKASISIQDLNQSFIDLKQIKIVETEKNSHIPKDKRFNFKYKR